MHDEPHAHDDSHTPGDAKHDHHHEHGADHHHGHSHDHHHHDDHHHHVHDHDHDHAAPRPPVITRGRIVGLLVVAALVALVWRTFYFVDETEYVFVTQFGDPVRLHVEPGLGIKMPYQSLRRLDRRLRMYDPPGREILTEDKENLNVDWYVCWRIPDRQFAESRSDTASRAASSDETADSTEMAAGDKAVEQYVLQFVQTLGNAELAEQRLEERIQAAIAAEISRTPFGRLVSLDPEALEIESLERRVTDQVRENAAEQFGIEVVDVRLKRLNYPESVKPDVFAEIRSERDRVARQYEAEGESLKTQISSLAELHSAQIMAQAEREAASIRAEGQAQAIAILNAAHRQDPEFYQLLKTLETYRAMLDERTTVVLSAESELLQLLTRGLPQLAPSPSSDPSVTSEDDPAAAGAADEDTATSGNGASQP